jgi:hypothetical protein
MNLIPFPKSILNKKGCFELTTAQGEIAFNVIPENEQIKNAVKRASQFLFGTGLKIVPPENKESKIIQLSFSSADSTSEAYSLRIGPDGIKIDGEGPAGVLRGMQTFIQLVKEHGTMLPCLEIEDFPDYPVRGFLHDVARGKVPTLATLKHLADKLAFYKINHLQLYIEHSFAFRNIPELWQGKDPLTALEIRELDRYCRDFYIDLVPCLATFGHLYGLLRIKRFEHLNELDIKASDLPFNLWDRMAHYTIDVSQEESFLLIKSMLDEFLPLFSSRYCNVCCDETFDLGKGRNREKAAESGIGKLYVEFVKKIIGVVHAHGKTPMMWGDIVLHHPEIITEIPEDTVFLNWGYGTDVTDEAARVLSTAGAKQFVCPGVQGWSRFANDLNVATENIKKMVHFGRENGAIGILNTDWGDCGHVNFLSSSYHGMALGAALSWNGLSYPENWQFDASFSAIELNDPAGKIVKLLRELGGLCFYHFGNLYAWVNGVEGTWDKENDVRTVNAALIERNYARATEIAGFFTAIETSKKFIGDSSSLAEMTWSAKAVRWTLGLLALKKIKEHNQLEINKIYISKEKLLEDGRIVLSDFEIIWRNRNKDSELRNVTETFKKIFAKIESFSDG